MPIIRKEKAYPGITGGRVGNEIPDPARANPRARRVLLRRAVVALIVLAALAAGSSFPASVHAQTTRVLIANIGRPQTSDLREMGASNDLAQSFTTGRHARGYTLTGIELRLSTSAGTTPPTVKVFSGSTTGTEVATLTGPLALTANTTANYSFTASGTVTLTKETDYWVVAEGGDAGVGWHIAVDNSVDANPAERWTIADVGQRREAISTGPFLDISVADPVSAISVGRPFTFRVNGTIRTPPHPTASSGSVTTEEDTAYTFRASDFNFDDSDGDALASVKIVSLPPSGKGILTLDNANVRARDSVSKADIDANKLKYTPPADANGTRYASFTFKVNDGTLDSVSHYTMAINVTAVDDAPTVANTIPDRSAGAGTAFSYVFPANTFSEVDNATLTYTATKADGTELPSWLGFAAATRTFSGTPQASDVGTVSVKVTASDGTGTVGDTFDITVYATANNAPTASNNTVTTDEDTAYTFQASDFNFSDSDNDTLASVKVVALPATGKGSLRLGGAPIASGALPKTVSKADIDADRFEYAPPADANGTGYASFTFRVNDARDDSAQTYTMAIDVTAVDDAPTVANAIPDQSAGAGTAFSYVFPANTFSEVDNTTLTYTATKADGTELPSWLGFAAATRTFSGTPQASDVGTVSVKVTASDGAGTVDDTFDITVYATANNAPTASNNTVTTHEDTAYTFQASDFNFSDSDNDTLASVKVVRVPATGKGSLRLGGAPIASGALPKTVSKADIDAERLEYAPPAGVHRTRYATFAYRVNDGRDDSAQTYEMAIDVTAVNDAPTVSNALVDQTAEVTTAFRYQFAANTFRDAEGDRLFYKATKADGTALPSWLQFNSPERTFSGTPRPSHAGTLSVKVTAKDRRNGGSGEDTFDITISIPENIDATGEPAISGAAQYGQFLTASRGNIADDNGIPAEGAFSYQWIRVDGMTETAIPNATSSVYRLWSADVGKTIKVRMSFSDGAGYAESRTSEAYPSGGTVAAEPYVGIVSQRARWTEGDTIQFFVTMNEEWETGWPGEACRANICPRGSGFSIPPQYLGGSHETFLGVKRPTPAMVRVSMETRDSNAVQVHPDDLGEREIQFIHPVFPVEVRVRTMRNDQRVNSATEVIVEEIGSRTDNPARVSIIVEDGPVASVARESRSFRVEEGSTGRFWIELSRPASRDIEVNVRTERTGGDEVYPRFGDGEIGTKTIVIARGKRRGVIEVTSEDDNVLANDTPVELTILEGGGYHVGSHSTGTGTFLDGVYERDDHGYIVRDEDDKDIFHGDTVTMYFAEGCSNGGAQKPHITVREDVGTVPVTVNMRGGQSAYDFSLVLVNMEGGGSRHNDYVDADATGTLVMPRLEKSVTFGVRIVDKPQLEDTESFEISLFANGLTDDIEIDRKCNITTIEIVDDDTVNVTLGDTEREATEGEQITFDVTVDGEVGNCVIPFPITVTLNPVEGSELLTTGSTAKTVRFPPCTARRSIEFQTVTTTGDQGTRTVVFEGTRAPDQQRIMLNGTQLDSMTTSVSYTVSVSDSEASTVDTNSARSVDSGGPSKTIEPPVRNISAELRNLPAEHDGASSFMFELHFSPEPKRRFSYRKVRDSLFEVANASITNARRLVKGSNAGWEVTVKPENDGDISISLAPTTDCNAANAVCTAEGGALTTSLARTVPGPVKVSVADASVDEAEGATLDFEVSLSRARDDTVTVDYGTSDVTANAGSDYDAASGTLTFRANETSRTVSVAVLDDLHDEGAETMTLTLSSPSGAKLEDATATGTINNDDPMPKAWLARFGREAAGHVAEAVAERLRGEPQTRVVIGGRNVDPSGGFPPPEGGLGENARGAANGAPAASASLLTGGTDPRLAWGGSALSGAMMPGRALNERTDSWQELRLSDALLASSFHLASAGDLKAGSRWSVWGRGTRSSFRGNESDLSLDGDVTTAMLGADFERLDWLIGVALARSAGDGSYLGSGSCEMACSGAVESTLTGVYPYARYRVSEKLAVWGVVGHGRGELTYSPEGMRPIQADVELNMAGVGARGLLFPAREPGGFELALLGDLRVTSTSSDAVAGLAATESDTSRVRLLLEGSRAFNMVNGVLVPSVELGLRNDAGDAEEGSGLDVGGSIRYAAGNLSVEASVRGLVAHAESDYEEWGVSGLVRYAPGADGRGLSMRLGSAWGADTGGAERLWAAAPSSFSGGLFDPEARLDAELGYGLGVMRGMLTPYVGLAFSENAETWRAGTRWKLGPAFDVSLEASLKETKGGDKSESGLSLGASTRW